MITLRKGNVVKLTDSEVKASRLEAQGFARDRQAGNGAAVDQNELIKAALKKAEDGLTEAKKENAALKQELDGTKEQLETAVAENRKAAVAKK